MISEQKRVAVIDVGSNSIKLLVASRGIRDAVELVAADKRETRISKGIGSDRPRLAEEGIEAGVRSVAELAAVARAHHPAVIVAVATSAVRDAENGREFAARVLAETGIELRILTGDEEALYIGRGVEQDPALEGTHDFLLTDLGGGSLELVEYRKGEVVRECSLPLGAVRVMERCVDDPETPLSTSDRERITAHVRDTIKTRAFPLEAIGLPLVGTGGAFNFARLLVAEACGNHPDTFGSRITISQLRGLYERMAAMTLAERRAVESLPVSRADIFPTALLTLLVVLEMAGCEDCRQSYYNLRYGLAAELLAEA